MRDFVDSLRADAGLLPGIQEIVGQNPLASQGVLQAVRQSASGRRSGVAIETTLQRTIVDLGPGYPRPINLIREFFFRGYDCHAAFGSLLEEALSPGGGFRDEEERREKDDDDDESAFFTNS